MKLAILNLTGGGISGGHKKYLLNMLPRLAAAPEIMAILCASPSALGAETWLPRHPKISYVSCGPFRPFRHSPEPGLAAALHDFSPDVIFVPIERYVNYKGLPVVVMLQNMAPLTGTKTGYGIKERLVAAVRKYETYVALRRSAEIIVPTNYVKNYLSEKAAVPAGKIAAIHYGGNIVSVVQRPPASFPFTGGRFIFTAGSLEAYRGTEDLLRALPLVKETCPDIKLAVAGGARPATMGYFDGLKELAARLRVSADIAWLGNLPEEELFWCYANCSAFAVTSRVESFCFVALEALSHGCNIISTDSPCLPEVLGGAALYYPARDIKAMTSALSAILARPEAERSACGAAAVLRAAAFSWDEAAAATLGILKKTFRSS